MAFRAEHSSVAEAASAQARPTRSRRLYPWRSWADGKVWVLTNGHDYIVPRKAFLGAAAYHARRSGLRFEWQPWQRGKLSGVVIQFHADTNTPEEVIDL